MIRGLLVALAVAFVLWATTILVLIIAGRRTQARELATLVPNLFILFRGLLRDPRVPRSSKVLVALAALWVASPIDLIPEFIPIAGPLDDAIVAALVLRHVLKRTDREVLAEYWRGDAGSLDRILRLAGRGRTGSASS